MSELFNTFVYVPLYNTLIAILAYVPWVDVGIAVIILTVVVKTLLLPLSLKAARSQHLLKKLEEPMKEIREKYKDNKQEQGQKLLELYKETGTNPFSGFFLILIQLPIIIGLYLVFFKGGLPELHTDVLYAWVKIPEDIRMMFLGLVDMAGKSVLLAGLAGATQYYHASLTLPKPGPRKESDGFQEDFARSMQMNVRYAFPLLMTGFAYALNSAVALYWITSNIFAICQEMYIKYRMKEENTETPA